MIVAQCGRGDRIAESWQSSTDHDSTTGWPVLLCHSLAGGSNGTLRNHWISGSAA